jgi:hypothetical protein
MVRQLGTAVMDQATTFTYDKLGTDETSKRDENAGGESTPRAVVKRVSRAVTGETPSDETVSWLAPAVRGGAALREANASANALPW